MELKSPEIQTEYKPAFDDKGNLIFKKKEKIETGSKARAHGGQFEAKVRKDLEEKGWIVDKWTNNVDLDEKKLVPAKRIFKRFNVQMGVMTIGTGFPDFIAFQNSDDKYQIVGVEVKMNGKLSREEKLKCQFLLDKKIFSDIWLAKKGERQGRKIPVVYENLKDIISKMRV